MPLETSQYINGLNVAYPVNTDPISDGDNHLRLIKTVLKNTFPNIAGPVTPTQTELNHVGGVTSAIQTQIDTKASKSANLSDIANAVLALTNLGLTANGQAIVKAADYAAMRTLLSLGTAALTASTDYATAAQGTKADTALQQDLGTTSITATAADAITGSGTYAVTPVGGNFKVINNTAAFTISAPVAAGDYTLVIALTNGAGAGAVTFSGFTKVAGDSLTTTNGHKFILSIVKAGAITMLMITAGQ